MILTKAKMLAVAVGLLATVAGGAGVMARQGQGGVAPEAQEKKAFSGGDVKVYRKTEVKTTQKTSQLSDQGPSGVPIPEEAEKDVDMMIAGFPLPANSDEDLGAKLVKTAKQTVGIQMASYENGTITIDRVFQSSLAYLEARILAAGDDQAAKIKAIEDQVRITGGILEREKAKYQVGQGSLPNVTEADRNFIEARIRLANSRASQRLNAKPIESQRAGEGEGRDTGKTVAAKADPKNVLVAEADDPANDTRILAELEKRIAMLFREDTPLEDVIKYIQTATTSPELVQGIPIYVDSTGLQIAGKSLVSPIRINLDGIKLKTSLRLLLKQIDMGYYVKHGLIMIMALEDDDFKDENQPGWREREAAAEKQGGGMGGGGGVLR